LHAQAGGLLEVGDRERDSTGHWHDATIRSGPTESGQVYYPAEGWQCMVLVVL
jgi:hypothetical protein